MRRLLSLIAVLAMLLGLAPLRSCPITGAAGHGVANGHTGHTTGGTEHGQHATDLANAASPTDPHGHGAACAELMRCHWAALPAGALRPSGELSIHAPVPPAMQAPSLPPDPFASTPPPRSSV